MGKSSHKEDEVKSYILLQADEDPETEKLLEVEVNTEDKDKPVADLVVDDGIHNFTHTNFFSHAHSYISHTHTLLH